MDTVHRCTSVDPARRVITVKYPENLPHEPYFMTYNPCECGQLVTVEAVTIENYLERGYHVLHQLQQVNHHANLALANYLGRNVHYPSFENLAYEEVDAEDEEEEEEEEEVVEDDDREGMNEDYLYHHYDDDHHHHYYHRDWLSRNDPQRRANLLGPVLDNLLVDCEYDSEDDEDEDYQQDPLEDRHPAFRSPYNDHQPRRPNLLGPVLQNWLVFPDYEREDESIENEYNRLAIVRQPYPNDFYDDQDEGEQPDR